MYFQNFSWWFLLLFVLLVILAYRTFILKNDDEVTSSTKWLVFVNRVLALLLIFLFLSDPFIKFISNDIIKPQLVVAYDVSKSTAPFSEETLTIQSYVTDNSSRLREAFDVEEVYFGRTVSNEPLSVGKHTTSYSNLGTYMQAVGGEKQELLVITDGNFNEGSNPLYDNQWRFPVHAVGVGDTTIKKDLSISDLRYNNVVFKGNKTPIVVTILFEKLEGEQGKLTLFDNGKKVYEFKFTVKNELDVIEHEALLDFSSTGVHEVKAVVSTSVSEPKQNNTRLAYVDVKETAKRIVCIAEAPHPDLRAFSKAWQQSKSYNIDLVYAFQQLDTITWNNVDVLVMHRPTLNTLKRLKAGWEKLPVWWITGNQVSSSLWGKLQSGITLKGANRQTNEVNYSWNDALNLFNMSEKSNSVLENYPPVELPFGQYDVTGRTQVLAFQKVGSLITNYPLITYKTGDVKRGVWLGEGFWRWQVLKSDESVFEELVSKYTRLMLTAETKEPLQVFAKNSVNYGDTWKPVVNVLNTALEPTAEAKVELTLSNDSLGTFVYAPIINGTDYNLSISGLKPGRYNWEVTATLNQVAHTKKGRLLVKQVNVEGLDSKADFTLLRNWSHKTGGEFYLATELDKAIDKLIKNAQPKTVKATETKKYLREFWWLLLVPTLLLGVEWFVRKRNGMK